MAKDTEKEVPAKNEFDSASIDAMGAMARSVEKATKEVGELRGRVNVLEGERDRASNGIAAANKRAEEIAAELEGKNAQIAERDERIRALTLHASEQQDRAGVAETKLAEIKKRNTSLEEALKGLGKK